MRLAGRVAIITGAASGLGKATATHFCNNGACVILCDLSKSEGKSVARSLGTNCHFHSTDVTNEDDVTGALDLAEAAFGQSINTVINCAGIAYSMKTLSKKGVHQIFQFQQSINVNAFGTFNVSRLAAERMAKNRVHEGERGVIINTASIAAYEGQIGQVAYAASKAAVVGMTLPLARDLAAFGIRVNTIAPGLFKTSLLDDLPQNVIEKLGQDTPFPARLGKPEEFSHLVECILGNKMLNGEVIRLDGGLRMAPK